MARGARDLHDPARLAAVRRHGLTGPLADADLDAAVTALRLTCGATTAVVSAVTPGRQTWVAASGTTATGAAVPDEVSLCAAVVRTGQTVAVPDLMVDGRWAEDPRVASGEVRAYAGEPLRDDTGAVLGAVCVLWSEPHELTADEATALRAQTRLVSAVLALRASRRAVQSEVHRLTAPGAPMPRVLEGLSDRPPRVLVAVEEVAQPPVHAELETVTAALLDRGLEDWARLVEVAVRRDDERGRPARDPLTGLLHRTPAVEQAVALLRAAPTALVLLGVDGMDALNEAHGTSGGDGYLAGLAARLADAVLAPALLARWTGDEFLVLLPGSGVLAARRVAEDLRVLAAGPVDVDGTALRTTSTAGVAASRRGGSWDGLLRDAGAALGRGKSSGRDRVVVATPGLRRSADREEQLRTELAGVLRTGRLQVHYQPQYRLSSRDVVGLEALVRWTREDGSVVPPAEFVPLAERTGLVVDLGGHVLRTACRDLATWRARHLGARAVRTWVNVSGRQLEQPDFAEVVRAALTDAHLPGDALGLEVTESVLAPHVEVARTLRGLRSLGVAVALDDFGTGYSSLGQLRHLPVDVLKADRSFVTGLSGPHGRQAAVLRAVVHVAHALSLEVVAEGVEDAAEHDAVRELGCEQAQGFLWSPAVPASQVASVSGWLPAVPAPTRSPEQRTVAARR